MRALGGGGSMGAASLGRVSGDTIRLQGMVVGHKGILYASEEGNVLAPEELASRLAQRLLKMGAGQSAAEGRD